MIVARPWVILGDPERSRMIMGGCAPLGDKSEIHLVPFLCPEQDQTLGEKKIQNLESFALLRDRFSPNPRKNLVQP